MHEDKGETGESTQLTTDEWRREYQIMSEAVPEEGDYLIAADGQRARIEMTLEQGRPPLVHTRAYVTCIVGLRPEWRILGENESERSPGLRVILASKSRNAVLRKFGIGVETVHVKALRVLRRSRSGDSLVAEICEW